MNPTSSLSLSSSPPLPISFCPGKSAAGQTLHCTQAQKRGEGKRRVLLLCVPCNAATATHTPTSKGICVHNSGAKSRRSLSPSLSRRPGCEAPAKRRQTNDDDEGGTDAKPRPVIAWVSKKKASFLTGNRQENKGREREQTY